MRLSEAIETLTAWSRKGRVLFTREELRKLFPHDTDAAFKEGITRLIAQGFLQRVARGLFLFTLTEHRNPHLLEQIAVTLRRGSYNYLSLESALSEYGVISQVPLAGITVMTTGRSAVFGTPYGRIEFTHTKRNPIDILEHTKDVGRPLRLATAAAASRDLRRVGRNVHLIDDDELEEVIANDRQGRSE